MGFLDRVKFRWDSAGFVTSLMDKWRPRGCKTEKDFENSLYKFLHEHLDTIQITKQYARGRIRADLVVGDDVIVELKHNLNTTAKYQRLTGQLIEYKEWKGQIVILLTGEVDPNLRKQLKGFIESEGFDDDWDEGTVTVVEK